MATNIEATNRIGALPTFEDSRKRMNALNAAAASYLGMNRRELRTALESGKSLADLATERGKDVDGLRKAMMAADPGSSGNGGINAMGLVDRVINAHRGPMPRSGPAVDPVPPRGGEEAAHAHAVHGPKSDSAYHTLPIQGPKAESPYHTTGGINRYI